MGIFKLRYFNLTISNKSEIDINPNMLTLKDLTFTYEENIPFLKHHDKLTIPIKVFQISTIKNIQLLFSSFIQ